MNNQLAEITKLLGNTDVYLIDQILKMQFQEGMTILDAGCGDGRNLTWFLQNNFNVFAADNSEKAVQTALEFSRSLNANINPENFRIEGLEKMSFSTRQFDVVICSAVLHFAKDMDHFNQMMKELWRVLKFGGFLFCRLASDIGIESKVVPIKERWFRLPDGSTRFLVNEDILMQTTKNLKGELLEPLKTVNVQNQRCMTTWIVSKVI